MCRVSLCVSWSVPSVCVCVEGGGGRQQHFITTRPHNLPSLRSPAATARGLVLVTVLVLGMVKYLHECPLTFIAKTVFKSVV